MSWTLMWLNWSISTINIMLYVLDIYRYILMMIFQTGFQHSKIRLRQIWGTLHFIQIHDKVQRVGFNCELHHWRTLGWFKIVYKMWVIVVVFFFFFLRNCRFKFSLTDKIYCILSTKKTVKSIEIKNLS